MNVYDFDGTIYAGDSTVDFFLFALTQEKNLLRYIPTQIIGFFLYGIKKINKTELKSYFFSFLSGVDTVKLVDMFWEQNYHKIYPWYLKQQQEDDIIISASPEFLLKPICNRIGIHNLIASRVDIHSGRFIGPNCRGAEKLRRFTEEYHVTRIDKFYSDSHSDLPLAQIAKQAFIVKNGTLLKWNEHESDEQTG